MTRATAPTAPTLALSLAVALGAATSPGVAEVVDSGAGGFTVSSSVDVAAPPEKVWTALVDHVDRWWSSDHTFFGDAAALSIDARPGGCFCEARAGGGVRHLEVVFADPGRKLGMTGGLGPLQATAAYGSLTVTLEDAGEVGTRATLGYAVTGYASGGLAGWAAPVDGVLREQLERLERYVEAGKPGA